LASKKQCDIMAGQSDLTPMGLRHHIRQSSSSKQGVQMDRLARAETTDIALPAPRFAPINLAAGRELEIKFKIDSAGMQLALKSELLSTGAAETPSQTLRSVYFDTPSDDLHKQEIVLRVRTVGGMHIMALKSPRSLAEGPFSRGEIEVLVQSPDPDIALFGAAIAAELGRIIGGRTLERKFETQIKRGLHCLTFGTSLIEVAFDDGFIVAGNRRQPLTEIELELKAGEEAALYDLALRLADSLPVRLDVLSKASRGFMLSTGETPKPVRAGVFQLPAEARLGDIVELVIASCLGQFVANWPALVETRHPDSIHQMRVALRRLRTALAFFKRILPCVEFDIFREEARRIASGLGPARDLDALRELVEKGPLAQHAQGESLEALLTTLDDRRVAAYAIAQEAIVDLSTTQFVLNLQAFLARQTWRRTLSGVEPPRLTEPAAPFACETLERLHKRVLKRGQRLSQMPPEERHSVRIAVKNLRYAAEFFSSFFHGARSYIQEIGLLQDQLGAYNDAGSATRLLQDVAAAADPQAARAAGLVLDWCGRTTATADQNLENAWENFKQTRIFWGCPNCLAYDNLHLCKASNLFQAAHL
jgi:inorganic triphosphatase YgiF